MKKHKIIFLSMLAMVLVVCSPFMFGTESCDDKIGGVSSNVNENLQNNFEENSNNSLGLTEEEWKGLITLKKRHTIRLETAISIAKNSMQNSNNSRTSGFIVSDVSVIKGENKTSSNGRILSNEDTTMYIINFVDTYKNPAGFVVMSADERVPDILAHSEKGVLSFEHYERGKYPPALLYTMSYIIEILEQKIIEFDNKYSSLASGAYLKFYNSLPDKIKSTMTPPNSNNSRTMGYCDNGTCNWTTELISSSSTYTYRKRNDIRFYPEWGTDSPYNTLVLQSCSCCSSAGYSAIAVAQTMVAESIGISYPSSSTISAMGSIYNTTLGDIRSSNILNNTQSDAYRFMQNFILFAHNGVYTSVCAEERSIGNIYSYFRAISGSSVELITRSSSNFNQRIRDTYYLTIASGYEGSRLRSGWWGQVYEEADGHYSVWCIENQKTTTTLATYANFWITPWGGRTEISGSRYTQTRVCYSWYNNWGKAGLYNGWYAEGDFNYIGSPTDGEDPKYDIKAVIGIF